MADQDNTDRIKEAVRRHKRETYTPVVPERQLGFIHNNVDCIGCRACEIACKDKNGLAAGPRFRRVMYVEGGTFPDVYAYKVNMSCNHCAEPACLPACPSGAIWKRADNGVVDIDSTLCIGCRRCEAACPYGAPQFDASAGVMTKCNFCEDVVAEGESPYCVAACPARALDFGELSELQAKYGDVAAIEPLPAADLTKPALVITPHRHAQMSGEGTGRILLRSEEG